ncbi:bifunctional 3'-5' exonuclease/DNA polymerase [Isoptericola sp. b490]|uniref:bifunctional 3'-5' exonuclease/DNA polymerase n=1 Tax=Actinotalea lenta TaxID=3064654 RepID=UPI0027128516|nr:bifunctional 3'-5' exonuclease/DNA polymerase [Isoptericola sp. b490]MDO8122716.1 bifunctional 3'-5' exonuclease/DNA polymerase [Isoptericola sp. b490]
MRWIVVEHRPDGGAVLHELAPGPARGEVPDLSHGPTASVPVGPGELARAIAAREVDRPRWVLDDVALRYPPLLAAGVRLDRCHDLRLCHAIVRTSAACAQSALATAPAGPWDARHMPEPVAADEVQATLFDALDAADPAPEQQALVGGRATRGAERDPLDPVAELAAQLDAVAGAPQPGRLQLLLAAESTGALIAAEMAHDGMPWDAAEHDRVLRELLGPRPAPGARPARLEELAARIRRSLDAPGLNPDSQQDLLHALRRAGLDVASTRKHEIAAQHHPVVAPLLEYKRLARLLSANGWAWLDTWVHAGRFRPDYVVGGVVTGRWATSGGGALQLPAQLRSAVRADPGWTLVVADAAQLEPRVLAAMSADGAMADAARGADLYQALADAGTVASRTEAKYGMLGAIYGATTGVSAALMPRLTATYPRAIGLVEAAARAGERGEVVSTWLGRSSPRPGPSWWAAREAAAGEGADARDVAEARRLARDWGRFTRNFVVQGTAAEWALCWLAALRRRLRDLPGHPHLVFFLHDEVMVHTPADGADRVAQAVQEAAGEAGRLLFGAAPVEFALDVAIVDSYDRAG